MIYTIMGQTLVHSIWIQTRTLRRAAVLVLLLAGISLQAAAPASRSRSYSRYWKGNLHTHTLWSDGDDFPDMVADWYKTNGYHFLALSDHNLMQVGEKWVKAPKDTAVKSPLAAYKNRFAPGWVETRQAGTNLEVRLKTLGEIRSVFEEKGRFLMIPSSEITSGYKIWPVHVNGTNLRYPITATPGTNVLDTMRLSVDAVLFQRRTTGQPMIPHINHPNYGWAITAEDMAELRSEKFFEIYNGHPEVHNQGDGTRVSTERMWDIVLALRLSKPGGIPIYGLATDDAHRYHHFASADSNPGRGWIQVRAPKLEAEDLIAGMERGDFYSSTGVELLDVHREKTSLRVRVKPEPGTTYTIRFIGTPKNFDQSSTPITPKDGRPYVTTRRYSRDVGQVLSEVQGTSATYELKGTELYVRAVVESSKLKINGHTPDEHERAWTQPLVATP